MSNFNQECETALIERRKQEELIPVITYVNGLSRHQSISAWLSYLSVCHNDCRNNVRLPGILSPIDEARCLSILDKFSNTYLQVEIIPLSVQTEAIEIAFTFIKGLSPDNHVFFKAKVIKICGEHTYLKYWEKLRKTLCFEDVSRYLNESLSRLQIKMFADFSIFVIALAILYGCGDDYYKLFTDFEEKLRMKFGNCVPFDRIGLCLWPVDFSFTQTGLDSCETNSEHHAILNELKAINPDTRVQVCTDSLLWSRDIIAWLDDEHRYFMGSGNNESDGRYGAGLLSEGGNIITGIAKNRFILVAQGALPDNMREAEFCHELFNRDICTYTLPDGFLWSRNPKTGEDFILDSTHLDTVINVVPRELTTGNRPKIIVDPFYYSLVKETPDFKRFLEEQSIPDEDIVIVDERELYLNLPNFSIVMDKDGKSKLLLNKDRGFTLPRLNLKTELLAQPDREIINMASYYGCIRCATNMLPESYIENSVLSSTAVSDDFPVHIRENISEYLTHAKKTTMPWIKHLNIEVGKTGIPWEFEEFSRTAYIYLAADQIHNPETINDVINEHLTALSRSIKDCLGTVV